MTIAAHEILTVANQICGFSNEAGYRSAISRAYYSVFHSCLEWEKSLAIPGSGSGHDGGHHQQLINRLRNPAPEVKDPAIRLLSKKIAARVDALRTKRVAADYFLSAPGHSAVDAANTCAQAASILQQLPNAAAPQPGPVPPPPPPAPPAPPPQPPSAPPTNGARPSLKRIL